MADDILQRLQTVNSAAQAWQTAASNVDTASARRNLLSEARKLVASLEDPSTEVWPRAFQVNVAAAIDVAWKMGVWEKLRGQQTISIKEILNMTGADEIMIIRIFRQLTAAGLLNDIPPPEAGYALTSAGTPYLSDDHCSFNRLLLEEIVSCIITMPDTLQQRGYKAPTAESGTPFKWAHGEELWTLLGRYPERAANMVRGMKSLSTGALAGDAYPFAQELGKLGIADDGSEEVAIVDIAGGQGHVMQEVREQLQAAGIPGRLIVQDLASTFEAVGEAGPPAGVEFMPYDMFTRQPVRDAHVYYYRHIFHDWSDGDVSRFLKQVVEVMRESKRPGGVKLLLVDLVLPNENVGMLEAARDMSMFPIGGLERNERQWSELLASNGLRIRKIWRGSEPEACVECELDV